MLITDKLRSYAAAKREIMPGVEHRQHKRLNNRAENSHQPTRRRERIMKRFKSIDSFVLGFYFCLHSDRSSFI
ncbi:MAG: putative transposase [Acetobacteraceae bacterium]|nr:putative transposase [Acetobacteraceae bacterium]